MAAPEHKNDRPQISANNWSSYADLGQAALSDAEIDSDGEEETPEHHTLSFVGNNRCMCFFDTLIVLSQAIAHSMDGPSDIWMMSL